MAINTFLDTENQGLDTPKRKTRAKKPRATKPIETGDLLALICKAATERFATDESKPGVHCAHLPDANLWYVAIHRYPIPTASHLRHAADMLRNAGYGKTPQIFATEKHEDLDVALQALALQPMPKKETEALEDLAEALGVKL